MSIVYGIDTSKPITPLQVRDAMIECFFQAHCQDAEKVGDAANETEARTHCKQAVEEGFNQSHEDFNNPTKQSLLKVAYYLASYSESFRDPEIIEQHKKQIMELINKLKE